MWPIRQFCHFAYCKFAICLFTLFVKATGLGHGGIVGLQQTYSRMFLKLICDPGLKLDLTSYIFGVPSTASRLGCKIRDFLPTGWPGPR